MTPKTLTCLACERAGYIVTVPLYQQYRHMREVHPEVFELVTSCGHEGMYWCPASGEFECPTCGGFGVCCAYPELHVS
jgi:hypothetical protein